MDCSSAPDHIKRLVACIDQTDRRLMALLSLHHIASHPPSPPPLHLVAPDVYVDVRLFQEQQPSSAAFEETSVSLWAPLFSLCLRSSLPARTDNRLAACKYRTGAKTILALSVAVLLWAAPHLVFSPFSFSRRGKCLFTLPHLKSEQQQDYTKCENVSPLLITDFGHVRWLPEVLPAVAE